MTLMQTVDRLTWYRLPGSSDLVRGVALTPPIRLRIDVMN